MHPSHLARAINEAIAAIKWASFNDPNAAVAYELYIAKTLENLAAPYKKRTEKLKTIFADQLQKPCDTFDLIVTTDITVTAKVTNPRESMDTDAFIKAVAEQYNISAIELHKIAETTVKRSAAPISFNTTVRAAPND